MDVLFVIKWIQDVLLHTTDALISRFANTLSLSVERYSASMSTVTSLISWKSLQSTLDMARNHLMRWFVCCNLWIRSVMSEVR